MNQKTNYQNLYNENHGKDDINILIFVNFLLRNKLLIGIFSAVFFTLFTLYSFTKKKTWEGQFQIVLDLSSEQNPESVNSLTDLRNLNPFQKNASLNTEVGILKSESVLMPIFEYVKKNKQPENENIDLKFQIWKDSNLQIELEQDSSILNISYQDEDKEIIIPVLEKIIYAYQNYSGKNKKRELKLAKDYLEDQIIIYAKKSLLSLKQAQEFAIKEDLTYTDPTPNSIESGSYSELPSGLSNGLSSKLSSKLSSGFEIEIQRVKAANKIRNLKAQIKRINELEIYSDESITFFTKILKFNFPTIVDQLTEIDYELLKLRSLYTENDISIITAKRDRRLLLDLSKKIALGELKSEIIFQEAIVESATRPKGVLLTYKELMRSAQRDEFTLIQLENNLRSINLESAKLEDPWELISSPNLKDYPIAPVKTSYAILGLLFGLFSGTTWCFIKEKNSDKIFDETSIENILETKIIETVKIKSNDLDLENKNLIIGDILNSSQNKNLKILTFDNISESIKSNLEIINKKFGGKLIIEKSLNKIEDNETLFLVLNFDALKFKDIYSFNKKLKLYNKKLNGIILIKEK